MKKLLIALWALMPMAMIAQDYHEYYNQLTPYPTPAQLVSKQVRAEKMAQYSTLLEQVEDAGMRATQKVGDANRQQQAKAQQMAQRQANAAPTQKQAQQAMAGDMMQIIQSLGIPMEKLAEMSDEELQALIMPKVSQNTGLSPEVMEKLSKMSDREAEAYMRSHPELMNNFQNSRFGQQAMAMQGMPYAEEDEADMERAERIMELYLQVMDERNTWTSKIGQRATWQSGEAFSEQFLAPYEERIAEIYDECWSRVERENPVTNYDYSERPVPAYVQSYYDRMNAIVDEANQALAAEWCKTMQEDVLYYRNEIEKLLPICDEQHRIYKEIKDPAARAKADSHMTDGTVYSAIHLYIYALQHRLNIVTLEHKDTPKTYVPAGGMG